jgi:hypothetical protein
MPSTKNTIAILVFMLILSTLIRAAVETDIIRARKRPLAAAAPVVVVVVQPTFLLQRPSKAHCPIVHVRPRTQSIRPAPPLALLADAAAVTRVARYDYIRDFLCTTCP